MVMKQQANRLEREMKQWEAREQRFAKLFSPSILQSRAFKKEKIKHFRQLSSQSHWSDNPEEKLTRQLLSQERRQLEKELYPNRLKRDFIRFVGSLMRLATAILKPPARRTEMLKAATDLKQAGFKALVPRLARESKQHENAFSLTDKRKINEREDLQYRPMFSKTANGQIRYDGHTVTLTGDGKTVCYKMDAAGARLGERQAYNLLSGRSVLIKGQWLSLDPNDRDSSGNLKIRHLPEKNGPDISAALSALPLKENRFAVAREELLRELKNGDKVAVTVKVGGKDAGFYITAGPRGLNLVDKDGKRVHAQSLKGSKIAGGKKVATTAGQAEHLKINKRVPVSKGIRIVR